MPSWGWPQDSGSYVRVLPLHPQAWLREGEGKGWGVGARTEGQMVLTGTHESPTPLTTTPEWLQALYLVPTLFGLLLQLYCLPIRLSLIMFVGQSPSA